MKKGSGDQSFDLYEIEGQELLGSCLQVQKRCDEAPQLSECSIQWYRLSYDSDKKALISGTYLLGLNVKMYLRSSDVILVHV